MSLKMAALDTAKLSTHEGHISTIPKDATPGLIFLSYFLPALDSLSLALPINKFLHKKCKIVLNGTDPVNAQQLGEIFVDRACKMSKFGHELIRAWDISGLGIRRTVMYESISALVLKNDSNQVEVKTSEFAILELEPMQGAEMGLVVVEMKSWSDTQLIGQRMHAVGLENAPSGR